MKEGYKKIPYTNIPNLEIDQFNSRTLKAIYAKLVRDYEGFFVSLQRLYGPSRQRKEVDNVLSNVRKAIALLRNIISTGVANKEDAETLVANIEEINKSKDYYIEQSKSVQALSERVSKVAETTGISLEDLTVTKDIVRKGMRQARVGRVSGAQARVLRGAFPETRRIAGGLARGVATAALGPFTPIAGMAYGITKDILGLGRQVGRFGFERARERKAYGLERELRPLSYAAPSEELERVVSARRRGLPLERYGVGRRVSSRQSKEEAVAPLMYFFDKKAHKAKWTRTVLKWIKESAQPKRGIFGGLLKGVGLAGAAVFAGAELYRLAKVTKEYIDVVKNVRDFEKKQAKVIQKQEEKAAKTTIFGKTREEREAAKRAGLVYRQVRQEKYEEEAKELSFTNLFRQWKTGAAGIAKAGAIMVGLGGRTEFTPSGLAPMLAPRETPQHLESIKVQREMLSAINNVAEEVRKEKELPAIRQAGLGNRFDSGDALLNSLSNGALDIED